ncbi:MAG: MFS transporter [Acidimicrobiales bacterium]|nr:MFS transporter [Acidimicrobiales bacterium]
MPARPPRSPLWRFAVVTAGLSAGYGGVFAVLADLRDRFGFSESQLGLFAGVGFFAGFVAQLVIAPLADRGKASRIVRAGLVGAALAMAWMAVATELWQFLLARIMFGLSSGSVTPAVRRLVITSDPDRVGENLGRLTAADVSGFVLGPVLAAGLVELGGVRLPFSTLAVGFALLLALAVRFPMADAAVVAPAARRGWPMRTLLGVPGIAATLCAVVAFYVTIGFFEATWALLLDDRGASTLAIGISLGLFTVPMIFLAPLGGRLAQQRGHAGIVAYSITAAAGCTLAYGWVDVLWIRYGVAVLHAVADSFTMPANMVAVAMAAPKDLAASAQGLLSATGMLVGGAAALVCGGLYEAHGPEVVYTSAAVTMMVFLGLSVALWRRATPVPEVVPA